MERLHEIKKEAFAENLSCLSHWEPRNLPRPPQLWARWSNPFNPSFTWKKSIVGRWFKKVPEHPYVLLNGSLGKYFYGIFRKLKQQNTISFVKLPTTWATIDTGIISWLTLSFFSSSSSLGFLAVSPFVDFPSTFCWPSAAIN